MLSTALVSLTNLSLTSVPFSSNRSIKYLLDQYDMAAELVAGDAFLHPAHTLGECQVTPLTCPETPALLKTVPTYDDISVILIRTH